MSEMKRPLRIVLSRLLYIFLFVALQAGVLLAMFLVFRANFAYYYAACLVLSGVSVLHVLGDRSNIAYKIAWVIPILAFPIFGGPFYFLFRRSRLTRRELRNTQSSQDRFRAMMAGDMGAFEALAREDPDAALQSRYLLRGASAPPYRSTEVRYYPSGESMYPQLLSDIKAAKRYVFMEYFIVEEGKMWNSILDVLEEKARQGVDVRILYDDLGCAFTLPRKYHRSLSRRGIRAHAFNPLNHFFSSRFNNRDHRKICVVDGAVGYTGGLNLADEYINARVRFGYWKDTGVRLKGDAVKSLAAMFLSMWDFTHCERTDLNRFLPDPDEIAGTKGDCWVQPYSDCPLDDENVGQNAYINLIARAREYVYVTTPYLIPDDELITALAVAAKSGVDVRVVTPRVPDKKIVHMTTRSYYAPLMEAGVKIYEFLPGFIHGKMAVSDDKYAVVGTINFDFRSLFLHYECAVWLCGGSAVDAVKGDIRDALRRCERITPDILLKIAPRPKFVATVLRLFAPLM